MAPSLLHAICLSALILATYAQLPSSFCDCVFASAGSQCIQDAGGGLCSPKTCSPQYLCTTISPTDNCFVQPVNTLVFSTEAFGAGTFPCTSEARQVDVVVPLLETTLSCTVSSASGVASANLACNYGAPPSNVVRVRYTVDVAGNYRVQRSGGGGSTAGTVTTSLVDYLGAAPNLSPTGTTGTLSQTFLNGQTSVATSYNEAFSVAGAGNANFDFLVSSSSFSVQLINAVSPTPLSLNQQVMTYTFTAIFDHIA